MARNTRSAKRDTPISEVASVARAHLVGAIDCLLAQFTASAPAHPKRRLINSTEAQDFAATYARLRNAAQALMVWHSSDDFLTDDGMPVALSRSGPRSLSLLAKQVTRRRSEVSVLIQDLETMGLVVEQSGKFVPARRSAIVESASPLSLIYATIAISRIVRTITHNYSGATIRRYERQVADVTIACADLPVFLQFVEQQGQYLIDAVDDWLSTRQSDNDDTGTNVSVGLGAFAWVDGAPNGSTSASRATPKAQTPK